MDAEVISPDVIVDSKSVKPKEKKPKLPLFIEKNKLLLSVLVVILALAIIYFAFFYSPYKYRFDIDGFSYVSNEFVPTSFFKDFKQNSTVFVSPVMAEGVTDSLTFNAMNLWQIVLIGNNVKAVQMIRVKDSKGNVDYCYTNDGNVFVNRKLSADECGATLLNQNNAVVFIEQSKETKVLLEKNRLSVFSPVGSVSVINFSVMKQIFPNAKTLVDIVNEKIYGIQ